MPDVRRGLSQKIVYAYNPLPNTPDEEIVRRTGLTMLEPLKRSPFHMEWVYSTGHEREVVALPPGEMVPFRESEIRDVIWDMREQGVVRIDDPKNEAAVEKARIQGLRAAHTYWNDRGAKKLAQYRKTHGLSADEMESYQYELAPRYRAKAMAEVLQAEIAKGPRKAAPAPLSDVPIVEAVPSVVATVPAASPERRGPGRPRKAEALAAAAR